MTELKPTIGIEVHVELKTRSKVFSQAPNSYGEVANSKVSVIDLGYPGVLPTLNKEVINLALKIAIALNCQIKDKIYFDRKNYFYPDLPKGFQITQSSTPIGYNGHLEIELDNYRKKIGIERVHIEEDTCKSVHEEGSTLLDFNRAGIPLVEIVTAPVIDNEREAILYLQNLRELLLYIGVSDVKIEEGSMRCDVNVSLCEAKSSLLGTKTETKNIGSISNVKNAISYEINRQREIINSGNIIREETRRYDEKTGTTILMRVKETGNDYRYFPEPDIPYVYITKEKIEESQKKMPLFPEELRKKYRLLKINEVAITALILNNNLTMFLNQMIDLGANPVISANILTGDVLAHLNKHNINIESTKLDIGNFKKLIDLLDKNVISYKICKEILPDLLLKDINIEERLSEIKQISDHEELENIIKRVVCDNPNAVLDYHRGYDRALKHLMGQVMKESRGQANPKMAKEKLIKELDSSNLSKT
jgi:aspartyl-tRNA(Asn)/glutamyl-tRNA(Gln) amidotransferase subunit B